MDCCVTGAGKAFVWYPWYCLTIHTFKSSASLYLSCRSTCNCVSSRYHIISHQMVFSLAQVSKNFPSLLSQHHFYMRFVIVRLPLPHFWPGILIILLFTFMWWHIITCAFLCSDECACVLENIRCLTSWHQFALLIYAGILLVFDIWINPVC